MSELKKVKQELVDDTRTKLNSLEIALHILQEELKPLEKQLLESLLAADQIKIPFLQRAVDAKKVEIGEKRIEIARLNLELSRLNDIPLEEQRNLQRVITLALDHLEKLIHPPVTASSDCLEKLNFRNEGSLEDFTQQILSTIVFPIPQEVYLPRYEVSKNNPHRSKFQVFADPRGSPYMLAEEDLTSDGDRRAEGLYRAAHAGRDLVVFAASGSGKSWLLQRVLKSHQGLIFVVRCKDDKNFGSFDLSLIAELLEVKFVDIEDFTERRKLAEFAIQCAIYARGCILREWRTRFPNEEITPERWLLVQLFPDYFFKLDVFKVFTEELFKKLDPRTDLPKVLSFSFVAID